MKPGARATVLTVFCAYIGFAVAGLALYGLVDDSPFIPLMSSHPALLPAWFAIEGGAGLSALAVGVGGLPIALTVLRRAFTTHRRDLVLLAVPPVAFGLLVVVAALMIVFAEAGRGAGQPGGPTGLAAIGFIALFIVAAAAGATALAVLVLRSPTEVQTFRVPGLTVHVEPYRFALIPAVITTLAMAGMLIASLAWGVLARAASAQVFKSPGFIGGPSSGGTYLGIVLLMAISTAVAGVAVMRELADHRVTARG
jgi:hypothetical protein